MLGQHGFLAHVFQVFNKFAASVDVIATSEVTVSLTLDEGLLFPCSHSVQCAFLRSAPNNSNTQCPMRIAQGFSHLHAASGRLQTR